MANNIKTWYDFVLQEMAAESYLDQDIAAVSLLKAVLQDGSNDRRKATIDDADLSTYSKTRMTEVQAKYFTDNYNIVEHLPNDASGFSATLMQNKTTLEYTLSFRSTEYKLEDKGGDYHRDALGTDAEIAERGFAFGQLLSMEKFWNDVVKGVVGANKINLTGYSLGGHLATAFTVLHSEAVNHTYTFNAPGVGNVPFGDTPARISMKDKINDMLAALNAKLHAANGTWDAWVADGTHNMYNDGGYIQAKNEIIATYNPAFLTADTLGDLTLNGLITQLYGHATHNDTEIVANSGIHAPKTALFIEGQPKIEGWIPSPSSVR